MTPNDDLFYRVLERIDADPKSFHMGTWYGERNNEKGSCGTVACFAGHTALELGWKPCFFYGDGRTNTDSVADPASEKTRSIATVAQEALGLTWKQADRLFDAYSSGSDGFATREDVINRWKDIQNESGDVNE
jgi:hypothetical protein